MKGPQIRRLHDLSFLHRRGGRGHLHPLGHHQTKAVHALLYLIVSLLSVAVIFFILGAPFVAALEVIIYAGAIMVLFVFVIMMLNLGPQTAARERTAVQPAVWIGPALFGRPLHRVFLRIVLHVPAGGRAFGDGRPEGGRNVAFRSLSHRGGARLGAPPGGTRGRLPSGERQWRKR